MIGDDLVLDVFLETSKKLNINLSIKSLEKIYLIEKEFQYADKSERSDAQKRIEKIITEEIQSS